MNYILRVTELINILAVVLFILGLFFVCDKEILPKHKAKLGIFMAITLLFYMLFLSIVMIFSVINGNLFALLLIIFLVAPFLLGHFSKYETVKLFTALQILCLIASIVVLFFI